MSEYRGSTPWGAKAHHYLSAADTNATLVNGGPSTLTQIIAINNSATGLYLKFYDKASVPTVGTDPIYFGVPIPGATGFAGVVIPFPHGVRFDVGLSFGLTGGLADNDTTAAATGVVLAIFSV